MFDHEINIWGKHLRENAELVAYCATYGSDLVTSIVIDGAIGKPKQNNYLAFIATYNVLTVSLIRATKWCYKDGKFENGKLAHMMKEKT